MRKLKANAILVAAGAAALFLPRAEAGSFSANFNDNAIPAGSYLNGQTGGGVIENGVLKITKTVGGQTGGFVIEDMDAGAPVYGFNFSSKIRVDSAGTPADGFSINFGPDISELTGAGPGEYEDGVGSGLRVSFDTYSNAGEFPPSPSVSLRLGTTVIRYLERPTAQIMTGTNFVDLNINLTPDGAVTLTYNGEKIFDNVYFAGYQGIPGGRFAIAGRTGGSTENVWLDDINVTTVTTPQVGIVSGPESITVLQGTSVTFAPVLNNVEGATFQWLKNGSILPGETGPTLTIAAPAIADSGTRYSLRITVPNNTVTTAEGVLTVIDIPVGAGTASYDFADGATPTGSVLLTGGDGGGYILDGVLHLTDAIGNYRGVFIVDDLNAGAPVYGFTANMKLLLGGGGATPADGFSFNFAPDIIDTVDGELEEGLGTGLTVTFDIYDNLNGGGEAPSVDVKYGGTLVAQHKLPLSALETGDQFADLIIRLENDGTLDVVYKGVALFNNLTIPNFSSITGGRYALAARTGGAVENIWVDDFSITPLTTQGDLRIVTQPVNKFAVAGQTVEFTAGVNDDTGVTYQWLRNGTVISSATGTNYSFIVSADDNGAQYSLRATKGGLTATSNPATVTIYPLTPTVSYNFDTGTDAPAGTILVGTVEQPENPLPGYISNSGGVNDSGVLHLTDQINGQASAFVIQPLLSGAEVAAINVAFDVLLRRPGTPADGFSFNWDDGLPDTTIGGAENGTGNGLTISFGIFNGGAGGSIAVKWNGAAIATTRLTFAEILTGDNFRKVIIKVTPEGKLDLVYGDRLLYSGLQLPGYAPITNGKFAFYARTGGLNADQWIDNLQIQAIKSVAPLRFTTEPQDALLFPGSTATFSAIISDPAGVTYQWSRNGSPISGANSATYTTPQLNAGDNNATYTLTATGPGGTAVSRAAVAHVVEPIAPLTNADVSFDFNDSTDVPAGTSLVGHINRDAADPDPGQAAYITADGGVNNSGVLHLTDNHFDQAATFYINNFDADEAVSAFTASFKLRIGGGTPTPADGTAFSWGTDILPESGTIIEEEGAGTGLIVTFDVYHNDGEQAPEFELKWQGNSVAVRPVPIDWLTTDADFADVVIRLEADGTVDVQYEGRPIFSNVQLPNFTPQTGANFAISARTGGLHANQWVDDLKIVTTSGVQGANLTATRNADGSMTIAWTGDGTLEAAPSVTGPWGPVNGATNPTTVQTTGAMQFFRVAR